MNTVQNIIPKLGLRPRNVFLLDGIGALISAVFLIALLAPFENIFGMPRKVLYALSIPAFGFAVYSLSCYFFDVQRWQLFLKLIALANFIYCCVTFGLVIQEYHSLTMLGVAYFLGEIVVIFAVISIELMAIKQHSSE
jgi:hypothetical protein